MQRVVKRTASLVKNIGNTHRLYHWNIPKRLIHDPIQKGDIFQVSTAQGKKSVLVMDVFREEFEETQKRYEKVIKVTERSPMSEVAGADEINNC